MNTVKKDIDHHDGVLFVKVEADSGITYLAVEPSTTTELTRDLLVRHGDPTSGQCGYYPAWLLFENDLTRVSKANRLNKRPPQPGWCNKMIQTLEVANAAFLSHA
jgi:hypothetical protein